MTSMMGGDEAILIGLYRYFMFRANPERPHNTLTCINLFSSENTTCIPGI